MKWFKVIISTIFLFFLGGYIYKNHLYMFSQWEPSVVEKNKYNSVLISYKVSPNRVVSLEENSIDIIFLDRKFKNPIEDDKMDFIKASRVKNYNHTIRSHSLYFFVKNNVSKNPSLMNCRKDRIINFEFDKLGGKNFTIICRSEDDKTFYSSQKMNLEGDDYLLYNLLIKSFKNDEPRWR